MSKNKRRAGWYPTLNAEGVYEFQPRVGTTLGKGKVYIPNTESVGENRRLANAFSVQLFPAISTQGCANPGLELANAFGVSGT